MATFENEVNFQCGIGSISMLISSHIHNAANRAIVKNSWQRYFEKFEVLFSRKTTECNKDRFKNLFLHFLPPLHSGNNFFKRLPHFRYFQQQYPLWYNTENNYIFTDPN